MDRSDLFISGDFVTAYSEDRTLENPAELNCDRAR
ncbi:hypothetical protein M2163_000855 [Streptomyces sp. SAI-135]|jgi:hypothetical protein|nr:hypothetical protein [Streptomyces sp. SAI-090]MDH6554258.1 hypothetical protein [Streptomyces sp. SAI-041]MDH6573518.1 hypothetical protein [Streptomyces sp. SAI-117]MDH6581744.1 hypothetical protein [Streptomyces sp. SAI-133]MDH6613747.1 hypothetical protein [Streptomyces sp. SAI-135]